MKKNISILCTFCLIFTLVMSSLQMTQLKVRASSITVSRPNGYSSTIQSVYANEVSDKYHIIENGDEYDLEFIHDGSGVLINNFLYSYKDFYEMSEIQATDLSKSGDKSSDNFSLLNYIKDYTGVQNTIDYNKINEQLVNQKTVDHSTHYDPRLKCNTCGEYSPVSPPTSGYKGYISGFMKMPIASDFLVALSSPAITALATLMFGGVVASASAMMEFIIGYVGEQIVGEWIRGGYYFRQANHTICPLAVKEERQGYAIIDGEELRSNQSSYRYFYNGNPY